ncbi:MAG: glucosidase, partial [Gemmatimonadaceae bacterium]|nr:glucosidase [Gloeobacterales cyanobacterium ES-bin-141]
FDSASGTEPELLFTDNETNLERLFGVKNAGSYVKDAFHVHVIEGETGAVNPEQKGTKAAFCCRLEVGAGETTTLRLRLSAGETPPPEAFGRAFEAVFADRGRESDEFDGLFDVGKLSEAERRVVRQSRAGLLWSKQFYHYGAADWQKGDPGTLPAGSRGNRNAEWTQHLYNRDVISMPDKWEYPWYATWDLAFHLVAMAKFDPEFAKDQLILFLREWYMHPNGAIPAYEFDFSDVTPPLHAWACWRVYKLTAPKGKRDRLFLARTFHKLLLNFTWWVNRKDTEGQNVFSGGFLGMDNIGVFDRSSPLPTGGTLEQADATAWMAFYCTTMLAMALELASEDPAYEDVASKFFEHFVAIADAMNNLGGTGLWHEEDGFYYDQLRVCDACGPIRGSVPLQVHSLVGIVPLFAVEVLDREVIEGLEGFVRRKHWFLENRPDFSEQLSNMRLDQNDGRLLLAIPSREQLERVLGYLLDENEFLSPHGIRSVSRVHKDHPYRFHADGEEYRVEYVPAEGNSNL